MFDVISTAHTTEWLSFPSLTPKFSYPNPNNQIVDFQVIPNKNCFALFHRKSNFELVRAVSKPESHNIQRIKKGKTDDLTCGAIAKLYGSELALGMDTGFVRLFSVQSGQFMPFKFRPDQIGNSVIGMDFSSNDEHLAVAYDSGDIGLFNLKAGVKTSVFHCSGPCTAVRFHPSRAEALGVGSFEGAITVFDIETKQNIFLDKYAHKAPVRDVSMFQSSGDVFASCGYDCYINVYDMRRGGMIERNEQSHPLSTICVSSCGSYCVAGNLKGEITTFDFRNMKQPLNMRRVHDRAVVRVAFIPSETAESVEIASNRVEMVNAEAAGARSEDSFFSAASPLATTSIMDANASINRRDSWASLINFRMPNNMSMNESQMSRLSIGSDAGRGSVPVSTNTSPVDVADANTHRARIGRRGSLALLDMRGLEEIDEEQHNSQPLPLNEAADISTQLQMNVAPTTRSVPLARNIVPTVTPTTNTAEPTAFATFFERMVAKRQTEEIMNKSGVYKILGCRKEFQAAYRQTVENSVDSERKAAREKSQSIERRTSPSVIEAIEAMQHDVLSYSDDPNFHLMNAFAGEFR